MIALRTDTAPMDLALVAVAAADAWANGNGLPRPRAYLATLLATACEKVARRHHAFVSGDYHARASRALSRMAELVNAEPVSVRAAVLATVLLDLLNDRAESGFGDVSRVLARIDRECPRTAGHDVERIADRIAERVRQECGADRGGV